MSGERGDQTYVNADGTQVVHVNAPAGFVLPPVLILFSPEVGDVTFYDSHAHGLWIRSLRARP